MLILQKQDVKFFNAINKDYGKDQKASNRSDDNKYIFNNNER